MNIFDGAIVMVSIFEMIVYFLDIKESGLPNMTLFRAMRLFRLFKLLRHLGNLRSLLIALWSTIKSTGNFAFLFVM